MSKDDKPKPIGSGWFSLIIGIAFILLVLVFWLLGKRPQDVSPDIVLAVWMIVSGVIMGVWGLARIFTTTARSDYRIGQATINLCVAIVAVTFTILAFLYKK